MTIISIPIALSGSIALAQSQLECPYEKAFGRISDLGVTSNLALIDLCVDRETGGVTGPISLSGLSLTMENGVSFTYEDLAGGSRSQMQIAPVITATYHNSGVQDQSPELNVLSGGDYFVGYLYNELASPSDLTANFVVHVGGGISIEGGSPLGFQGQAKFVDGTANIVLSDNTQYGTAKGTVGSISMTVDANGEVTGSGSIQTQNIRSAGYSANEWVSMTVTIDELRGFATGPSGQVIKNYALVSADIIDAEGDSVHSKGSFEVFLYDPKIWE